MKKLFQLIILFCFLINFTLAQSGFKQELKENNPVQVENSKTDSEKLILHQAYLKKAISEKNTKKIFFGHLYLFVDYYKNQNYIELTKHLNEAEKIANNSDNKSWLAAIYLRKGVMSDDLNNNYEEAIQNYKMALQLNSEANDSLLIGECLEQISTKYSSLEKYDTAHYYYNLALPLLEKFASRTQMASTYNNYNILLKSEGKYSEAKPFLDSAIVIAKENKDEYKETLYNNNLGALYNSMEEYEMALKTYQNNILLNNNRWKDLLTYNYIGLTEVYEKKGDYKNAFENLKTFYLLKDSISGANVQLEIADLNTKFKLQEKELTYSKTKQTLQKRNFYIFLISLLSLVGIISWWLQVKRKQKEINQHKENLKKLSNILVDKYNQIIELNNKLNEKTEPLNEKPEPKETDVELDVFNQKILTTEDWSLFKSHFEKAYPRYIARLRSAYSTLSEAEERLFILIKLNLKSKEIAVMLGISADSVKKTRNRLRKRLELKEEVDLETFIMEF